jgi:hypothetical protein
MLNLFKFFGDDVAGGKDNGKPGLLERHSPNYYAAFVFDPDGQNIEATCRAAN